MSSNHQAMLWGLVVLGALAPRVAAANPTPCCTLEPNRPFGETEVNLTLTVRKTCLAAGVVCPAVSTITVVRDGAPHPLTWTVADKATACVYTTKDLATTGTSFHEYEVTVPLRKDWTYHVSCGTGWFPDGGGPDGQARLDSGTGPKDAAADARRPPATGGDKGCAVAAGSTPTRNGARGLLLALGALIAMALRRRRLRER